MFFTIPIYNLTNFFPYIGTCTLLYYCVYAHGVTLSSNRPAIKSSFFPHAFSVSTLYYIPLLLQAFARIGQRIFYKFKLDYNGFNTDRVGFFLKRNTFGLHFNLIKSFKKYPHTYLINIAIHLSFIFHSHSFICKISDK